MTKRKSKLTYTETHARIHSHNNTAALNKLRAAVLGANDGIISVAGVVAGVAGATNNQPFILTAGVAALVAGALSMAAGEYVSVSSQRDTQLALLRNEKKEIEDFPEEEFNELVDNYKKKGLSDQTAQQVARELTAKDAYAAHVDVELHIDPNDLNSPWQAAFASALAFFVGATVPILAILFSNDANRIAIIFASVVIALIATGILSSVIGGAGKLRATLRVLIGGILAMVVTYGIGNIFGTGLF
jgi:VIT1/CCC1 family predicted Fe2+/Mn2+ transporter